MQKRVVARRHYAVAEENHNAAARLRITGQSLRLTRSELSHVAQEHAIKVSKLRVGEITPLLSELEPDELEVVRRHEANGKARAGIVSRIDALLGTSAPVKKAAPAKRTPAKKPAATAAKKATSTTKTAAKKATGTAAKKATTTAKKAAPVKKSPVKKAR